MAVFVLPAIADTSLKIDSTICGDDAVIQAYNFASDIDTKDLGIQIITGKHSTIKIDPNTPYTEPCYFYAAATLGVLDQTPHPTDIEKISPALAFFKRGIGRYFARWHTNEYPEGVSLARVEKDIETNFHKTILSFINTTYNDEKSYWKNNMREKKQFLWVVNNHMRSNANENEKQMIGWASLLLTKHYMEAGMTKDSDAFKKYLIEPLIKPPVQMLIAMDTEKDEANLAFENATIVAIFDKEILDSFGIVLLSSTSANTKKEAASNS